MNLSTIMDQNFLKKFNSHNYLSQECLACLCLTTPKPHHLTGDILVQVLDKLWNSADETLKKLKIDV